MKKQTPLTTLGIVLAMLILILDSRTALEGARDGMNLLITTVIPSLFPFFFLSIWLGASADSGGFFFLRILGKLCKLPKQADGLLIPAFLGGYPAGAQAVFTLWNQDRVSKETAETLLTFCNNAGPSFLFGILSPLFPERWMVWVLWGIHIAGAIFTARLHPCAFQGISNQAAPTSLPLTKVLSSAISVMASVCGWLLLFRVVLAFLNRWILWFFPLPLQTLMAGLLELTNGCCLLPQISDLRLRFLLCSGMLAMGGLCVTLQTMSVTKGLSLKHYLFGKLLQTLFSICASTALICQEGLFLLPLGGIAALTLWKREKSSSIPLSYGV